MFEKKAELLVEKKLEKTKLLKKTGEQLNLLIKEKQGRKVLELNKIIETSISFFKQNYPNDPESRQTSKENHRKNMKVRVQSPMRSSCPKTWRNEQSTLDVNSYLNTYEEKRINVESRLQAINDSKKNSFAEKDRKIVQIKVNASEHQCTKVDQLASSYINKIIGFDGRKMSKEVSTRNEMLKRHQNYKEIQKEIRKRVQALKDEESEARKRINEESSQRLERARTNRSSIFRKTVQKLGFFDEKCEDNLLRSLEINEHNVNLKENQKSALPRSVLRASAKPEISPKNSEEARPGANSNDRQVSDRAGTTEKVLRSIDEQRF
jgi:hypothetical protein